MGKSFLVLLISILFTGATAKNSPGGLSSGINDRSDFKQYISETLNNQRAGSYERNSAVPFYYDLNRNGHVRHLRGKLTGNVGGGFAASARTFLQENKSLFGFEDLANDFIQVKQTAVLGMEHLTLQQVYQGIPVLHHQLKIHSDVEGSLSAVSNGYYPGLSIPVIPQLSKSAAIAAARHDIGKADAEWRDIGLVIYTGNEPRLAYKLDVSAAMDKARTYIIDANDGSVLDWYTLVFTGAVQGRGINALGETVEALNIYYGSDFKWEDVQSIVNEIDTDMGYEPHIPETGKYNLVDESDTLLGRIITTTSEELYFYNISFVNSASDSFNVDSLSHPAGVSAHEYHRKTLDYFHAKFGRGGWLYPGCRILSSVDYGYGGAIDVNNAFYVHWARAVNYGMGSGNNRPNSAGLDVCAHEMTHGITKYSSGLIYQNQPGALNESMSDVFGYLVEAEYQGGGDWLMAEDVSLSGYPIRNMQDPPAESQPDHMKHHYFVPYEENPSDGNDQGGVHTNSGIPNKVFYLLVQGDSHYGFNIKPLDQDISLSRDIAAKIWYSWNEEFLFEDDDFQGGYEKMLQVCSSLYPGDNETYSSVQTAWAAVGISQHCDVDLSGGYITPGSGRLCIAACLPGTGSGYSVKAMVSSTDSLVADTVELLDDGLHGDDSATDQTWGGFWSADTVEKYYSIDLAATDTTTGVTDIYFNSDQFTTVGPVSVDSVSTPFNSGYITPGSDVYFEIALKNYGQMAAAEDVWIEVRAGDEDQITLLSSTEIGFGNIGADSSVSGNSWYSIRFKGNMPAYSDQVFYLDIYSGDYLFWSDSFSIYIHPLGTGPESGALPDKFALHQNYPNPFNPTTIINYDVPFRSDVQVRVYDLLGNAVATLVSESQDAGSKSVRWDASDAASGVYFYQVRVCDPDEIGAGEFIETRKMLLLK